MHVALAHVDEEHYAVTILAVTVAVVVVKIVGIIDNTLAVERIHRHNGNVALYLIRQAVKQSQKLVSLVAVKKLCAVNKPGKLSFVRNFLVR